MRGKIGGRFRVRFAKIAGGIGLVVFVFRMFSRAGGRGGWLDRFRRGRNFFGAGRTGLGNYGTWAAATTAATTASAGAAGPARGGGQI
jgi:hypothetical protein